MTELLPSCGKTSTDEELLLIDEERKQFPEMDAIHVKDVAKTVEMASSGDWNEQTLQELKTAHYRTPYQQ